MKVSKTELEGVLIIEPRVFRDERGFFFESFNQKALERAAGIQERFVQDNHSCSAAGTLRGLHYQLKQAQGKLIRLVSGKVYDAVVDLRPHSINFGRSFGIELNAEEQKLVWVPPGFAHGFYVIDGPAHFLYKVTDYYSPDGERSLRYDCPELRIDWPISKDAALNLSDKDRVGLSWQQARSEIIASARQAA